MVNIIVSLLLGLFFSNLFAEQKQITVLVGGTGTGYQTKILKFAMYCPRGMYKMTDANEYKMGNFYTSKYRILSQSHSDLFDKNHIYNFGWSGNLGFDLRDKEGELLAKAIEKLAVEYKDLYQEYPYFRVVTFSHGGNIALNLGKYFTLYDQGVHIDLIMLAPPVQAATKDLVFSKSFTNIYHVFSDGDVVQRIDPQNLYAPVKNDTTLIFSDRYFLSAPVNCKQARITIKGNPVGHLEVVHGLMSLVPYVIEQMQNHREQSICNINIADQSYIELKWYNFVQWYYAHCQ